MSIELNEQQALVLFNLLSETIYAARTRLQADKYIWPEGRMLDNNTVQNLVPVREQLK